MHVTLLGPVACEHEGRQLPLGGSKQRAAFALLALEAGRVVGMDRLIDELWPDDPPAQAVVTLRAYVSRLRKVLEPTPARVTTRPPGWVLDLGGGSTDLDRFTALLAEGRAALTAGGPDELRSAVELLERALGLWSGDALGDLRELPFARDAAARLDDLHDSAVESLLDARLAAGQHEVVVEQARRFVVDRPFRERAWCALMVALYRSQRQAEALAAYGSLRRMLADELGLDPSPALQDLEGRMLRHDPALRPPEAPLPAPSASRPGRAAGSTARAVRTSDGGEGAAAAPRPAAGRPLVGRDGPLTALRRALAAAAEGQGGLVVVSAPTGAGKTTLLQAWEDDVVAAGGRVLHGRGLADGAAPALWPWVTVLHELVDLLPVLARDRWKPEDPAALALSAMSPAHAPQPVDQAVPLNRSLLFRGVIDLLGEARAQGLLVVLVDDAHWLDADTRTLLTLACEELADRGVLFVAATRSDEPGTGLPRTLGSLRRDLLTRIALDPLDEAGVATLIEAIDGCEPPPRVSRAVLDRTGGNALFVTELVRLLSAEGPLTAAAAARLVPAEVVDVLGRRLDRLPTATAALLGVAALFAPGPFDLDLLARVSGLDEERALDACEGALLAGLLVETTDGTGRFALSHGLVRDALASRLSGARRVHLHAKIAAALQQRGPVQTDEVLEVARQLVLAAPAVGPAAAVPYLISAAEDALRRSATSAAHSTLSTALELVAEIQDVRLRESLHALVQGQLHTVRMWGASFDDDPAEQPPPALTPPDDGPSVAAWLGTVVAWAVRGHYGWAVAQASGLLAGRPGGLVENAARWARGAMSLLAGHTRTAREDLDALERVVAADGDLGVPGVLFHVAEDVYAYRALLEHQSGNDAAADLDLAELARWSGSTKASQVKCDFYLGLVAALRGDPDRARNHAERCHRLAQQLDFAVFERQLAVLEAWADALEADPAGPSRVDAALAAYRGTGVHYLEPTYLMLAAEAHASRGDVAAARLRARESAARADQLGEHYLAPRLAALRATLDEPVAVGAASA